MNPAVVIPARYQSSRLPGKPLIELLGGSIIRRTHHRVVQAVPRERVWVATDDRRILDHCRDSGIQAVMTPSTCLTGTDRVACFAREVAADAYINVQGDEPVMDPEDVRAVWRAVALHPGEVINGMAAITEESLFRNPSIPKVVARPDGRLLYMSRAAIPTGKDLGFVAAWRQVCVYGFPPAALAAFAAHGRKTPLEAIEDIEILRFLELDYEVRMIALSDTSVAVDTAEDIPRAEAAIRRLGQEHAF